MAGRVKGHLELSTFLSLYVLFLGPISLRSFLCRTLIGVSMMGFYSCFR